MTHPVEIIRKKRDKEILSAGEIDFMTKGCLDGRVTDYQIGAFLMAGYLNGLHVDETYYLTKSIIHSGEVLTYSKGSKIVDKHSTGGIGDKTSFIIAPICAALGLRVPMISGRALGHTGGTLDKLEAIPGLNVDLSAKKFKEIVDRVGCVIAGQTSALAPADKRLYMLRDFTATVESKSLITASILGKKMAAGVDNLVLDVKVGSGAFMTNMKDAKSLAKLMVKTGIKLKKKIGVLLSKMDGPLGHAVGNANEIHECVYLLTPDSEKSLPQKYLFDLCLELCSVLIFFANKAKDLKSAKLLAAAAVSSGKALNKFIKMTSAQGGRLDELLKFYAKPNKTYQDDILLFERSGVLTYNSGKKIGEILIMMGGGRYSAKDKIDHKCGLHFYHPPGEYVSKGGPYVKITSRRNLSRALRTKIKRELKNNITINPKLKLDKKRNPLLLGKIMP
jgi:pyrimidine-nucleoside phosphorylase